MTMISLTPLEPWIGAKIGLALHSRLTRQQLETYQLAALNRSLHRVRNHSPFYRRLLWERLPAPLASLDDLGALPFTQAEDIRSDPLAFLCVSRDRVARVVTIRTSATSGAAKRLHFGEEDLELTLDFIHHGMTTLVQPQERVLVLLPAETPDSIGDLVVKGLARIPAAGVAHGPVHHPQNAIEVAVNHQTSCLMGVPVQVLAMASHPQGGRLAGLVRTVLLTTDYVPDALAARIERSWDCKVYRHYGMTEMGLGGALECAARRGYHLREADLLVEIIDPVFGQQMPDGQVGEIVFTTLTRKAMPLVRYRTGDLGAIGVDPCPCGTVLKTLAKVTGRLDGQVALCGEERLTMGQVDEALFAVAGLIDHQVRIDRAVKMHEMTVSVTPEEETDAQGLFQACMTALRAIPAIGGAETAGQLSVTVRLARNPPAASNGIRKRRIEER